MAKRAPDGELAIRPLTPTHVDDVKVVTRGTWGASCWDIFPRYTPSQQRERGLDEGGERARRAELARLARRSRAPGLVAYLGREPIGWIAVGPRFDFSRIERSRASPPVDDVAAWVIPCITVRRGHRGRGVAIAMIRAAVAYAERLGAPAVEAYPRAASDRTHDDFAYFGTAAMFRKAGFRQIRGTLPGLPKSWVPRVTMRRVVRTRAAPGAPLARRGRPSADAPRQARRAASARPRRSRRRPPSAGARRTGSGQRRRAPAR
jgi:GNAT superfamily N-acetyltransferase